MTLDHFIQSSIDNGQCTGAQVYASQGGNVVVDGAWGLDGRLRPVQRDSLFALYCASKPVVALAVAVLVSRSELRMRDTVAEILGPGTEMSPHVAALTVHDLLSHRAGLHHLTGVAMGLHTPHERDKVVMAAEPPVGWNGTRTYAEYGGWHLLGRIVECIAGVRPDEYLAEHCQVDGRPSLPSGLFLAMSETEFERDRPRIALNATLDREGRARPLLMEATERVCREFNPGFGGYATMRALGEFYENLLQLQAQQDPLGALLRSMLASDGPPGFDVALERHCSFGLGVMTDLPGHYFGSLLSRSSFGHSGNVGALIGFADPATRFVASVSLIGTRSAEAAVYHHRGHLVDELLGLALSQRQ